MAPQSLRNFEDWAASLRNFEWIGDALPGMSDMDAFAHCARRGGGDAFIIIEGKRIGERMGLGQKMALAALQKQPGWTVVIAYGPDKDGYYTLTGSWQGKVDQAAFRDRLRDWWSFNKGGPTPLAPVIPLRPQQESEQDCNEDYRCAA